MATLKNVGEWQGLHAEKELKCLHVPPNKKYIEVELTYLLVEIHTQNSLLTMHRV
jgi:hypothetical protein